MVTRKASIKRFDGEKTTWIKLLMPSIQSCGEVLGWRRRKRLFRSL